MFHGQSRKRGPRAKQPSVCNAALELEIAKDRQVYKGVQLSAVHADRKQINRKRMLKRKTDGSFMARVVVQDCKQVPGLESGGIYSPTDRRA